jgi:hypothetical protein
MADHDPALRVRAGRALIHRAGVDRDIEALLRPDGHGGRPRQLRVDVFLAGLPYTVVEKKKKTMALTLLHELLTRDLVRYYQTALGIRPGGEELTIRQVRYLLEAIEREQAFTEDSDLRQQASDKPLTRTYPRGPVDAVLQKSSSLEPTRSP